MSCSEESQAPVLAKHEPGMASSAGVSFKFQKKKTAPLVLGVVKGEQGEEKDFVTSLEDKEIQSSKGKVVEKEHVVRLIEKNVWRQPAAKRPRPSAGEGPHKSEEEAALDKEAADAIIKDMQEAMKGGGKDGRGGDGGVVVPLLLQNKPPMVPGKEGDELADVDLRPDESTAEDYEAMPIEKFGEAVLRGMGWNKGEAIGKTNKGLTEPIEFISRPRGLGLGATPKAAEVKKTRIKKPGEVEAKVSQPYIDKDGRVKHVKKIGEEIPPPPVQGFVVGNVAKVLKGPHADLCGKIVGLDEDNARVILKMAINGQTMMFSRHTLALLEDFKERGGGEGGATSGQAGVKSSSQKYGLVRREELGSVAKATDAANRDGGGVLPRQQTLVDDGRGQAAKHSKQSRPLANASDEGKPPHNSGSGSDKTSHISSRKKLWVAPNLRVRIVDRGYKKGQYYNVKVVILDVVSMGTCVCQTAEGRLLEDIHQSALETVVPKETNAVVQVLVGSNKGQLGIILDRDRHKDTVTVEMSLSKEVLTLGYDDVCEHVSSEHY